MKKTLLIFGTIVIVAVLIFSLFQTPLFNKKVADKNTEGVIAAAIFNCTDKKVIQSIFLKNRVELILSDGRNMLLNQAVSASGARYANNDESFVFWNKGDTAFIVEGDKTTFSDCISTTTGTVSSQASTQMANPASVNCSKLGGNLIIKNRGDGGQYGLCYFEDNRACEEWALFRGDCPVGGRRTTGYDTIDQNYCAWSGGETFAVPNSICTFKNGLKCSTIDFYNGKCSSNSN